MIVSNKQYHYTKEIDKVMAVIENFYVRHVNLKPLDFFDRKAIATDIVLKLREHEVKRSVNKIS